MKADREIKEKNLLPYPKDLGDGFEVAAPLNG